MMPDVLRKAGRSETAVLLYLGAVKLLVHLAVGGRYGFFRDELYYIVCGQRPAFGYIDHPPFTPLAARVSQALFGDSLLALRVLPALAGAAAVVLAGLIARKLGGGRLAQALAAVSVLCAPVLMNFGYLLTNNAFDVFFWTLAAYLLTVILKDGRPGLWPALGLVVGLGLQNKYSIAFFVAALGLGLLLGPARVQLKSPRLWAAAGLAAVVFLPNLLWQIRRGLPFLEFNRNAVAGKNAVLSPLQFLGGQLTEALPMVFFVVLIGLLAYLFAPWARSVRAFGWAYLALTAFFILTGGKPYYMAASYPVMAAGGAVALERFGAKGGRRWLGPAVMVLVVGAGILASPLALPVLSVDGLVAYTQRLGLVPPAGEREALGALPQHFADQFGWTGLVDDVARVYDGLSEADKAVCGIFTQNYGEASAVNVLGRRRGLPFAASGHNSYWAWGPPPGRGAVMIVVGGDPDDHRRAFGEVTEAARHFDKYAMPYESDLPIFLCRSPKVALKDIWPSVKKFI